MTLEVPVEDDALHVICQDILGNPHIAKGMDHANKQILLLGIGKELHIPLTAVVADHSKASGGVLRPVIVQNMAFEDRIGLLVDAEWNARKNNHLTKLIRQATFSDPGACLENVEYLPDRGLKQEELLRFGTCNYIQEHHNIILLGATGSGKTYLACALGMAAARRFFAVKYIRLPDLLVEFQIARGNGTIRKLMAQYKKYALLIIDEWLLYPLKETEARDLLEIVESRYKRNSTIFCSQFDIPGWPEKLSDPLLADAICDRIVHDAYTMVTGGKESMRKRKGLQDA